MSRRAEAIVSTGAQLANMTADEAAFMQARGWTVDKILATCDVQSVRADGGAVLVDGTQITAAEFQSRFKAAK